MIKTLVAALALLAAVAVAVFARTLMSSPLPLPGAYAGPLPAATPPAEMAVYQIPTGVTHRSSGFAYRGGSFLDARDFAMSAVLVTHPRGDVLIDTGFGRAADAHVGMMPFFSARRPATRAVEPRQSSWPTSTTTRDGFAASSSRTRIGIT